MWRHTLLSWRNAMHHCMSCHSRESVLKIRIVQSLLWLRLIAVERGITRGIALVPESSGPFPGIQDIFCNACIYHNCLNRKSHVRKTFWLLPQSCRPSALTASTVMALGRGRDWYQIASNMPFATQPLRRCPGNLDLFLCRCNGAQTHCGKEQRVLQNHHITM